jgi:hypothetical protein
MRVVLICLASIVLGFFLMFPLGKLFDAMDWPLFHTWGLAHGSFVLAWPLLAFGSAGVLFGTGLARKKSRPDSNSTVN